jgi:hypothetical protein
MTSISKLLPPASAGALARLRVPGMDASVVAAIDAAEALEASTVAPIRDRFQLASERELDPHAAPGAAIAPEPTT